ncbi:GNAT family N-acetyltransferase [Eubacteriales bacterium OttesenSCG-928-M02]|nr:GNAT family N-acetyltransferase [Eubacteriales bacterium OttesenSCG-928-M02]
MRYFKKIEGERIYLSPINVADYPLYTKWFNDSAVTDGLGYTNVLSSLETEKEALEALSADGYNFAIIRSADDTLLGNMGFNDVNHRSRSATCGLFIGEEENRGKGYGTEALILLLSHGFRTLNFHNIMLKVFSFNHAAIACYKKVGFQEIGRRRQSYFLHGQYHDDVFMDMLSTEFFARYGK